MNKKVLLLPLLLLGFSGVAQKNKKSKMTKEEIAQEAALNIMSDNACKCIDSVETQGLKREDIVKKVSACIDKEVMSYQLMSLLTEVDVKSKKKTVISIDENKDGPQYKKYYYELERYLLDNCSAAKKKSASNEEENENSVSSNREALKQYNEGSKFYEKSDYKSALPYFEKAVEIDPRFAFAWDNIGICYRKLGDYDKAIEAYTKSLFIDPNGVTPLQNIAVAYKYKGAYDKAIQAYEKLNQLNPNDAESYYGIGHIYAFNLKDDEKGLDYMCKAYLLYVEQKSPYRSDAEKVISLIYASMKKDNKEKRFMEIMKQYNLNPQ